MESFATTHWISKQISYQHYLRLSSIHASALIIAFKLRYSLEHLIKFNSTEVAYGGGGGGVLPYIGYIGICGPNSLVILKLDLELIATESPFAPNNYLSDPN